MEGIASWGAWLRDKAFEVVVGREPFTRSKGCLVLHYVGDDRFRSLDEKVYYA